MPLNIKNEESHLLAKELADLTGESITAAVTIAIREAVQRRRSVREGRIKSLIAELRGIAEISGSLPVHDSRTADEIIGYDDRGLPS